MRVSIPGLTGSAAGCAAGTCDADKDGSCMWLAQIPEAGPRNVVVPVE